MAPEEALREILQVVMDIIDMMTRCFCHFLKTIFSFYF